MITAVITVNATTIDAVVYKDDARVGAIHADMEQVLVIETALRPAIETVNAVWVAMEEVDNKVCSVSFPNVNDVPWGVVSNIIYRDLEDHNNDYDDDDDDYGDDDDDYGVS